MWATCPVGRPAMSAGINKNVLASGGGHPPPKYIPGAVPVDLGPKRHYFKYCRLRTTLYIKMVLGNAVGRMTNIARKYQLSIIYVGTIQNPASSEDGTFSMSE